MKTFFCYTILFLCSTSLFSQGYQVTYPMSSNQGGLMLKEQGDVFQVVGYHYDEFTLGQISKDGILLEWEKDLAADSKLGRHQWTSDGGWISARRFDVAADNMDVELSKYDSAGNQEWRTIFGDDTKEWAFAVKEATDGSYYVLCTIWSSNGGDRLFKVSASGEVIWSIDFASEGSTAGLFATPDGGCMAIFNKSISSTRYDNLIKINPAGEMEWQEQGGPAGAAFPHIVFETSNGNFISASSRTINNTGELYINQYNAEGETVWELKYEDPDDTSTDDQWAAINAMTETANGDYVIAGLYDTGTDNLMAFLSGISSAGEILWTEYINENVTLLDLKEDDQGDLYAVGRLLHPTGSTDLLFLKTNNVGIYSNNSLAGQIFQDFEIDCTNDMVEAPLFHWLVEANGNLTTHYANSNGQGAYHMNTQIDDYQLKVYPMSPYWEACQNDVPLSFTDSSQQETFDFPMQPIVICPWLELSLGSPCRIRPGATSSYVVNFCNYGTAAATDVQLSVDLPSEAMILEVSEPYTQNGLTLSFSLADVAILECREVKIKFEIGTDVPLGTTLCASAHITPDDICLPDYIGSNPSIDQHCILVVGSFDPNNKLGNPIGLTEDHLIPANKELGYTIQFQNTGTDTAFRVVLLDSLPEQVDLTTFRPGASSHPYEVEVFGSGILRFIFDPIALVDSMTNEAASQGFVKFSIDQKPDLPPGTQIANTASIYFDYNFPIRTEPWIHTIEEPTSLQTLEVFSGIAIYPNPSHELININGEGLKTDSEIYIYNSIGSLVIKRTLKAQSLSTIQINHLEANIYFYKIESNHQIVQAGKIFKH